jgi:hypothetical protein
MMIIFYMMPAYGSATISRFLSTIDGLPVRLMASLYSFFQLVDNFTFFGEGFGFFTLGSGYFGGVPSYVGLRTYGISEGTLGRVIGEVGLIGAIFLISIFFVLLARGVVIYKTSRVSANKVSCLFFVMWSASMMFWSLTHDVFANTVSTFMAAAFSGGILCQPVKNNK